MANLINHSGGEVLAQMAMLVELRIHCGLCQFPMSSSRPRASVCDSSHFPLLEKMNQL